MPGLSSLSSHTGSSCAIPRRVGRGHLFGRRVAFTSKTTTRSSGERTTRSAQWPLDSGPAKREHAVAEFIEEQFDGGFADVACDSGQFPASRGPGQRADSLAPRHMEKGVERASLGSMSRQLSISFGSIGIGSAAPMPPRD